MKKLTILALCCLCAVAGFAAGLTIYGLEWNDGSGIFRAWAEDSRTVVFTIYDADMTIEGGWFTFRVSPSVARGISNTLENAASDTSLPAPRRPGGRRSEE